MNRLQATSSAVYAVRHTSAAPNHPSPAVKVESLDASPMQRHEWHQASLKKDIDVSIEMAKGSLPYNLRVAERAKAHARSLMTRGSNAVADAAPGLNADEAERLIDRIRRDAHPRILQAVNEGKIASKSLAEFPNAILVRRTDSARFSAAILKEHGFGFCTELTAAAWCYIKDEGPSDCPVAFYKVSEGDHSLLVIGDAPHQVVCDPWANKAYPLSDLPTMQLPENDVKSIRQANGPHYLSGGLEPQLPWIAVSRG